MHVFIAGVMQADRTDRYIESQDYRAQIGQALRQHIPDVQILDPYSLHPNSVDYDDETARNTFLSLTKLAGTADLLIAYLPKPSMGTAMEMWQAFQADTYIVAVTPYVHHWAVRFTANEILPDLQTLLAEIENGRIPQLILNRVDALPIAD
ncbi:MAG: hypothetical protein H6662_04000 [Ardenticatenaceae bacterium]|nr:hypothetical protein [Anaerolineales bacterium]MCB8920726.1 hypothetical protein [Ardenticatenaceae bacterium]MCB8989685.1 hypothetical protein [Ardenticatenaceae bacterium]MCB9002856.1 hypothetical protein [Ardenticatenaceae bacterium]